MKLAAVYACIYVVSSNIAQMPLHVMRKTNNKVEAARDHPVFYRFTMSRICGRPAISGVS